MISQYKALTATTAIIGAGGIGAGIGWGKGLAAKGNRGGDTAGSMAATVAMIPTFFGSVGAMSAFAAPKPLALIGAGMIGAGALAAKSVYDATV